MLPDRHPIPCIQDMFDSFHGSAWFSVLDQGKAYHQGFLKESSRSLRVKLSAKKCEHFKNQVRFLGKIVSKDMKNRKSSTVGELRIVLGFISYYRAYIANFSRIAKPLYALLCSERSNSETSKGNKKQKSGARKKKQSQVPSHQRITWTEEHSAVLCQLIHLLSRPPVLGYPNFEEPFILHCDASGGRCKCPSGRGVKHQ